MPLAEDSVDLCGAVLFRHRFDFCYGVVSNKQSCKELTGEFKNQMSGCGQVRIRVAWVWMSGPLHPQESGAVVEELAPVSQSTGRVNINRANRKRIAPCLKDNEHEQAIKFKSVNN